MKHEELADRTTKPHFEQAGVCGEQSGQLLDTKAHVYGRREPREVKLI